MRAILTCAILIAVCGSVFAATRNPYAQGQYEQGGKDVMKCVLYGITVDGTLYPVKVDVDGSIYTN